MIQVKPEVLKEAVKVLRGGVNVKSSLEDLNSILIVPKSATTLEIYGTDRLSYSKLVLPARVSKRAKPMFLTFSQFSQYVDLWQDLVHLTIERSHVIIKSGRDKVKLPLNKNAKNFRELFPKFIPKAKGIKVQELPYMINASYRIVSTDHRMPVLEGVHVCHKDDTFLVEATDGFQYVRFKQKTAKGLPLDSVLNVKCGELLPLLPSPGLVWSEDNRFYYKCSIGSFAVIQQALEEYPSLDKIPRSSLGRVTINRGVLADIIKKVNIVGSDRLELSKRGKHIHVKASSPDSSADRQLLFEGTMAAEMKGKIPHIIVNTQHISYLHSLLRGDMSLHFGDESNNVWAKEGNMIYLTTPYSKGKEL